MYVDEKDRRMFRSIQEELMGNFRLQEVDYLTVKNISGAVDSYDDIYHETPKEDIVLNDPISIPAYVHHMPRETMTAEYGIRYKRSIVVLIHKDYELDNGIQIELGQFFRWDNHLYQILHQEGDEKQIWGNPDWQVYSQYLAVLK